MLHFERLLQATGVRHAVTTVTENGDTPFNIADHIGPSREAVAERRRWVCDEIGIGFDRLTSSQQVHGANVVIVDDANAGSGQLGWTDAIPSCDGLITNVVGVSLMSISADCPLVLMVAPAKAPRSTVLATVHASWRALTSGILANAMTLFTQRYHADAADVFAAIAPSAGPCCYEVRGDFVDELDRHSPWAKPALLQKGTRTYFDLWAAARTTLIELGAAANHIETPAACTICDERFFSYRRQGKETGRFALFAGL